MSPELLSIYRQKVAYGEDPREVKKYIDKLEKSRLKTEMLIYNSSKYVEEKKTSKQIGEVELKSYIEEVYNEPPLKKQRV